ncbi:hypothetical protein [Desulfomonile tiedjei]|nr:hypothetical protein [Desulfomonile tiedjei]
MSILVLAYMMYYPIPAVLNLILPEPAISQDLWTGTPIAMWACTLGCTAMAAGAALFQTLYSKRRDQSSQSFFNPPPVLLNVAFFLFLLPAVILRFNLGMYDARFDPDILSLIERTGQYNNILGYLSRFSQMGMLLQLYRAITTRSWKDFTLFGLMASVSVLVFLPTGSRMAAYGWVPWFLLFYLTLERKIWRAGLVFLCLLSLFTFTTALVQVYRNIDQLNRSFSDRLETISEIALGERVDASGKSSLEIVVSRLSDFAFAGRILQDTPSIIPFRESEGLDELYTMMIPKVFVHERPSLQLWDASMDTYGVTRTFQGGGSAPPMFIGDLYSRWGWSGIVGGMFILGIVLAALSALTLQGWTVTSVCFYALYVQYSASLVSAGLFTATVLLSRELFINWAISVGIGLVCAHFFSRKSSPRRVPGFFVDEFKRI